MAISRIQTVQSLDMPELELYLTLRRVEAHERAGVLVAANNKVIKRLLLSRFTVLSVLLTPPWLAQLEPQLRARAEDISVYVAEASLLETITGYKLHQGYCFYSSCNCRITYAIRGAKIAVFRFCIFFD